MPTRYEAYLAMAREKHGAKFNSTQLDPRFVEYFNNRKRIKVETMGITITGTVGVTTGFRPAFIIKRRSSDFGSSWIMGPADRIIGVQSGRKYSVIA